VDFETMHAPSWLPAAAMLLAGAVGGVLVQKALVARIRAAAAKSSWRGDDVVVDALGGAPLLWCVLGGLFAAVRSLSLPPGPTRAASTALLAALILSVTLVAARVASGLVRLRAERSDGGPGAASLMVTLVRMVVLTTGLLVLFQTLGLEITPILTTLGIGGLAVALALQPTLANFFAGLHVLLSGKVRKGDYVKLQSGEEGFVGEITWRDTAVHSLPNNLVVIPNSRLAEAIVTNYDRPDREMAVLVQVGVAYDSDLEKVERVTIEVAREVLRTVEGAAPGFDPFIRFHTFGDFSVNFTVILRARQFVDQYVLKHEFVKRLHRRYAEEGITIPFPVRTVHVANAGGA
jgi:small-conductance mechanosensitive channel